MPDTTAESNKLLKFLSENADHDWIQVYNSALDPDELHTNIENVQKALKKLHLEEPVGAILGGTGALKKAAGVESQLAVQALKTEGRIVQAGKGRGKAVCILNSTPLAGYDMQPELAEDQNDQDDQTEDQDNWIPADNLPALISAVALQSFQQNKQLKEANKKLATALVKIATLEAMLQERSAQLETAEAEVNKLKNTNITTTWS